MIGNYSRQVIRLKLKKSNFLERDDLNLGIKYVTQDWCRQIFIYQIVNQELVLCDVVQLQQYQSVAKYLECATIQIVTRIQKFGFLISLQVPS